MISIALTDERNTLFIDYQEGGLGFTVTCADDSQLNFSLEEGEREVFKAFVEAQIRLEKND